MYDIIIYHTNGIADHIDNLHAVRTTDDALVLVYSDGNPIKKELIHFSTIEKYAVTKHVVVKKEG